MPTPGSLLLMRWPSPKLWPPGCPWLSIWCCGWCCACSHMGGGSCWYHAPCELGPRSMGWSPASMRCWCDCSRANETACMLQGRERGHMGAVCNESSPWWQGLGLGFRHGCGPCTMMLPKPLLAPNTKSCNIILHSKPSGGCTAACWLPGGRGAHPHRGCGAHSPKLQQSSGSDQALSAGGPECTCGIVAGEPAALGLAVGLRTTVLR